ncbi:MAG: DNA polymerase III subunit gamma/tau [bacterium]|nr:DNA polymerase III subunit gamma/tau [bacterium]MDZ4299785.1 DNA polymerase III subunit gamma/tau [Candidatus Sungbacteria bacterium]
MNHLVLYRKHRPTHFDDVVGQGSVVNAIQNAIKTGRVAHAYLFSGPRGVGKTTMARLIAKSLNCERHKDDADTVSVPCNVCASCREFADGRTLDVIEIDAASNRGIDEIRELRDAVRFVPTGGRYKTYIIDEVHMLTTPAFNALLKTLEEPPSHAVFILATTELEKVPATIISRTQHYSFRRPSVEETIGRLAAVAKKESVSLESDAAHLIAFSAGGSLRDAEGILGQIMAVEDKKITRREVEETLGMPPREAAKKLFAFIAEKKTSEALALAEELHEAGHDAGGFIRMILQYFRSALLMKIDPALKKFIAEELLPDEMEAILRYLPTIPEAQLTHAVRTISDNLMRFKNNPIPQLPLEVTIVELCTELQKS